MLNVAIKKEENNSKLSKQLSTKIEQKINPVKKRRNKNKKANQNYKMMSVTLIVLMITAIFTDQKNLKLR